VIIVELGGTVGDIEGLPFLEAIRQFKLDVGQGYAISVHVTLVPYIKSAGEIKTKPTQHSVGKMREIGIQPDIILCRTEKRLSREAKDKIALFCNVHSEAVIPAEDVKNIYEVPVSLQKYGLDKLILRLLNLRGGRGSLTEWQKNVLDKIKNSKKNVKIAVVGKYIALQDAYKSIYEALTHGAIFSEAKLEVVRVEAEDIEKHGVEKFLTGVHGLLVPGGFGDRGIEGKIKAVQYARENHIPYFGICLGMHTAVIEFARNVCGMDKANSTEFSKNTKFPVISLLEEQKKVKNMGATMRLGAYECNLNKGTKSYTAYKKEKISERHRHRYEFNNKFKEQMKKKGLVVAGAHKKKNLVEIIELKDHPWFVAGQFHPEFKSKPDKPHPLFRDFIKASLVYSDKN
jgi:CTP synthase